jgi:Na+/melibiose symporter-like transporter
MTGDNTSELAIEDKTRELHGFRLIGYTLGTIAFYLPSVLVGVYSFQFYVYTVHLDALLTSIGLTIPLILGGIFSPIFGKIIDNKKPFKLFGKWVKRRVFLLYGLPIWIITNIMMWRPPWMCPPDQPFFWPTALYFWIVASLNTISQVIMQTAHGSILPEISQTYKNRRFVGEINTVFTISGAVFAVSIPLIIQSLVEDPEHVKHWDPSGQFLSQTIFNISIIVTIFATIVIIISFFSIDESFHQSFQRSESKISGKKFIRQMFLPLKDKTFIPYLIQIAFMTMGMQIFGMVVFSFQIYTLKFSGSLLLIYPVVSLIFRFGWYFGLKEYSKKKKIIPTMIKVKWFVVIAAILNLCFFLEMNLIFKIILFAISVGTIMGGLFSLGIFGPALSSSIIDEAAKKNTHLPYSNAVSQISGSYIGMMSFVFYIGPAIGSFLLGGILSGERATNPTIITILMVSISIFIFLSLYFNSKIKLKNLQN